MKKKEWKAKAKFSNRAYDELREEYARLVTESAARETELCDIISSLQSTEKELLSEIQRLKLLSENDQLSQQKEFELRKAAEARLVLWQMRESR